MAQPSPVAHLNLVWAEHSLDALSYVVVRFTLAPLRFFTDFSFFFYHTQDGTMATVMRQRPLKDQLVARWGPRHKPNIGDD